MSESNQGRGLTRKKRKKRYEVRNTMELKELLVGLDGDVRLDTCHSATWNAERRDSERIYSGISVHIGNYAEKKETFRDYFGFSEDMDITFYEQKVYVCDETADTVCMEIFSSQSDRFQDMRHIVYTVFDLRQLVLKYVPDDAAPLPVISVDDNFELKGSVTIGAVLNLYSDNKEGGLRLILEIA